MGLPYHTTNNSSWACWWLKHWDATVYLEALIIGLAEMTQSEGIDPTSSWTFNFFNNHLATPGFWFWRVGKIPFHLFFSGAYYQSNCRMLQIIGEEMEDPSFFQRSFAKSEIPNDASVYLPSLPFVSKILDLCRSTSKRAPWCLRQHPMGPKPMLHGMTVIPQPPKKDHSYWPSLRQIWTTAWQCSMHGQGLYTYSMSLAHT